MVAPQDPPQLLAIRRGTLALVLVGLGGLTTELVLTGHSKDSKQLMPVVTAIFAAVTSLWVAARPSMVAIRALQLAMLVCIGTGVIGIALHLQAATMAVHKTDQSIAGMALIWKLLESTSPPAFAPALMAHLGLLGLLVSYKHPALGEIDGFD